MYVIRNLMELLDYIGFSIVSKYVMHSNKLAFVSSAVTLTS